MACPNLQGIEMESFKAINTEQSLDIETTSLVFEMLNNIPDGFEKRAFIRAVHFVLHSSTYEPTMIRGGMRKKISKRQRLINAYIYEINRIIDKSRKFTCQGIFPSTMEVTHKVSLEGYEALIDMIVHKLDIFAKVVNLKSIVASAFLCVLNIWANLDRPATVLLSIGQFLMNLQLSTEVLAKATEYFTQVYTKISESIQKNKAFISQKIGSFTCQSKFGDNEIDFTNIIPYIGSGLAVLFSLIFLRAMPGSHTFDNLFTRFSKISGVIRSAADVSKIGGNLITEALDSFCKAAFGVERPVMDEWKNIRAWSREVSDLMKPDFENDLKGNEQLKQKIESLLQQGMNILRTLDALKVAPSERSTVSQCVMFLMRARESAGNCGAGQTKPRVAPAITHIYGDSGVGKSTVLWALIAEIQAALGVTKPSDLHEKTYFRRPGAKFWDGYSNGVNVVVCDDFGAMKDSENAPNEEFLEAIHMSNTAFWQLNMAELSDKRSTFFQAKSVIWTSNRSHFAVESLTNSEAVLRRVDLKIRQKPHPEFSKKDKQRGITVDVLDQDKVDKAIQARGRSAMLGCVLFDVIDKTDPNDAVLPGCSNLTFWQIAEKVVNKTISNMKYFDNFNSALNDHMQDAIERCAGGTWSMPEGGENKFTLQSGCTEAPLYCLDISKLRDHRSYMDIWNGLYHFNPMDFIEDYDIKDPRKIMRADKDYIQRDVRNLETNYQMFQPAKAITITDNEQIFCRNVTKSACFKLPLRDCLPFIRCWTRARRSLDLLTPAEQTDEMFVNYFIQSQRILRGAVKVVSNNQMCSIDYDGENKFSQVSRDVVKKVEKLNAEVEARFAISPTMFYTLVGVSTLVLGFAGHRIYKRIVKWWNKPTADLAMARVRSESAYDAKMQEKAKTLTMKMEGYSADQTKAKEVTTLRMEGYSTDQTKAKETARLQMEAYASDTTKALPTMKIEGFLSDTSPPGHTNHYGQTYDELSIWNKILWKLGHADIQPAQNVMKTIAGKFQVQAVFDKNAAEVVDVVFKNMYKLEYFKDGEWTHALNLTIIKGRLAIVNRHLLMFKDEAKWRIRNSYFEGIEFNLQKCNYAFIDDSSSPFYRRDVMILELPREIHQHRDITSKFMTGDDFSRFHSLDQISAIGYVPCNDKVIARQYFGNDVVALDQDFEADDGKKVILQVRKVFKYNIQTTPGDCGAVLVAFDKNFNNKIFGIHSGGTVAPRYTGFGTPVTQGFLFALITKLQLDYPESLMSPNLPCIEDNNFVVEQTSDNEVVWTREKPFEGNFYHFGKAPERIHVNVKSRISPSPVYGVIQKPTMAPARLGTFVNSEGEKIDPMVNARAKASPISKPLDEDILKTCMKDYSQLLAAHKGASDKRVLTYEEGISGVEGDACYPPMKRSTSPGYGWDKRGKGKTQWLGETDYIYDNPELKAKCNQIMEKCIKGERPSIVWTDTLKDERRTLDKVEKGKTRLFSCGEMAFTLVFRQYFGGFIAFIMRNKISVESCVGTNVYSRDWTQIVDYLKVVGPHILAGDFANYDGTLHPSILWGMCDLINHWYGSENIEDSVIRTALWSEVVNSIHITGNTFYMWNHSQPSGCPMTVILNCLYHSISARYVYIVTALKYNPKESSLSNFRKNVRHLNYGDDDLWSISPRIIDWFNQVTITEAYTTLGMTYTDEAKTGDIVPYRKLEEVNFLKRTFRWDDDQARYRAPLALETIREMAMWNHGTVDQYELTASILQDAVHELAQHDEKVFNTELPAFEKAAQIVRERFPVYFDTYQQYQFNEVMNLE